MNRTKQTIALKPYLETITRDCEALSKQELIDVILGLAGKETVNGRESFLNTLKQLMPGKKQVHKKSTGVDSILEEIQGLKEAIEERIKAIESGNFDQIDDWDWEDHYGEEYPDEISEDQMSELTGFFHETGELFISGQIKDAREVYTAVFALNGEIGDFDSLIGRDSVDLMEERARYARCVYDLASPNNRLKEFASAMDTDSMSHYEWAYPMVKDVANTRTEEMTGLQDFFPVWRRFLEKKAPTNRVARLLAETVFYMDGIDGIAALSRTWKNDQPHGYLTWIETLQNENQWDESVGVAREALSFICPGEARKCVSSHMIDAGEHLSNPEIILEGKRENFYSGPCDSFLLSLLEEAVKQNKRAEELASAMAFLENQAKPNDAIRSIHIKCLLMSGNIEKPFSMIRNSGAIGWSHGLNVGLVFGAVAFLVSGIQDNAATVKQLLTEYAEKINTYSYMISISDNDDFRFSDEVFKGLTNISITDQDRDAYGSWLMSVGKKRIESIVSNKHRSAYKRAAMVLGCLAETCAATGDHKAAKTIVDTYCKEKFSRHRAFREEMRSVISASGLLKKIGVAG